MKAGLPLHHTQPTMIPSKPLREIYDLISKYGFVWLLVSLSGAEDWALPTSEDKYSKKSKKEQKKAKKSKKKQKKAKKSKKQQNNHVGLGRPTLGEYVSP
jgi:hypothetical protein